MEPPRGETVAAAQAKNRENDAISYQSILRTACGRDTALSKDLGHGDGRGRWVKMVYLRGMDAAEFD